MLRDKRPVFLNLWQIRFPVTAVMSIMHRVTGVILFLALPAFIFALQRSLQSEQQFNAVLHYADSLMVKILLVLLAWSLIHHLFAGLRYLLLDIDMGIQRHTARMTAWLVILAAIIVPIIIVGLV